MNFAKFFLTSKTVLFGAGVATIPALLAYVGGLDWTTFGLSPPIAALIGAAITALRFVTVGPVTMKRR